MEHCATNVSNKITCPIKLVTNAAFIAKSESLLGEYNKTRLCNAMAMCYSIRLRGSQVYPNYWTNWQFIACQGITCSKPTTETLKQVVTLPTVNNKNTRKIWIALLVCLHWLPWTSPHWPHLCLWACTSFLSLYYRSCFENKESSKFTIHMPLNEQYLW